jgi:Rgg/GadR/MutR family transcriptional activator
MQSKTDGEVLKQLRAYRKITQTDCCQGIISRHTYSKIERNQTSLHVHILIELLERLNVSFDDFLFLKNGRITSESYRKKFAAFTKENIQSMDPSELYKALKNKKESSMKHFHYYLLCKNRMTELKYGKIEGISKTDLNRLNSYIHGLTFFSTNDLALFSDMCSYLSYQTAKYTSSKIIKQLEHFLNYYDLTQAYQQAFHQVLYAITSMALTNNDYLFAQYLLEKTKEFIFKFPNHYYLVMFHLNTDSLNYQKTKNSYYLY